MKLKLYSGLCLVIALCWLAVSRRSASTPTSKSAAEHSRLASRAKVPPAAHGEAPRGSNVSSSLRVVIPSLSAPVSDWSQWKPESITIAPEPGLELPFHVVRVTEENGVTTWVGRNALKGAFLVGIGKKDRWDGVLTLVGSSFDIHVHGDDVKVFAHTGAITCLTPTPSQRAAANQISAGNSGLDIVPVGNPGVHASGSTIYTVDVAFYYPPDCEDQATYLAGSVEQVHSYLDSTYRAYIEANNLVLEQSLVPNMRWHFLGMYKIPNYVPTYSYGNTQRVYSMTADITAMQDTSETGKFISANNKLIYADQSVMVVGYQRDVAGLSGPGEVCVVTMASEYGPVHAGIGGGHLLVAHEMGHNFGLSHDRVTDNIPDTDTGYNYGYRFLHNDALYGGNGGGTQIGDVMSYSLEMPYYSNPSVSIPGSLFQHFVGTLPDPNSYVLGVAEGQPKAADASRVIRESALTFATRRQDPALIFPAFTAQPLASATVTVGSSIHLSASATGTGVSYQWRKDGVALSGATAANLTIDNASPTANGAYDVMVTNRLGSVISRASLVTVSNDPVTARLANISTRSQVGTGNAVQIAGFVISGSAPKTVLIRAAGPALVPYGVAGTLNDPTLELHNTTGTIGFNDDWSADSAKAADIEGVGSQVGASAWTRGSKDAAIVVTLNPGAYSAIVAGKNGATGIAIVEVFEVGEAGGRVVNISTRSSVSTGDAAQIAGFVVGGSGPKTVLIRASGPALANAGITGALADPFIELHDAHAVIGSNDDWSSDAAAGDAIRAAAAATGAFAWTAGSKDAAILVTLNPGVYSAVVTGKNGGSGVALVEVYDATP
jgi:hypothetical protein